MNVQVRRLRCRATSSAVTTGATTLLRYCAAVVLRYLLCCWVCLAITKRLASNHDYQGMLQHIAKPISCYVFSPLERYSSSSSSFGCYMLLPLHSELQLGVWSTAKNRTHATEEMRNATLKLKTSGWRPNPFTYCLIDLFGRMLGCESNLRPLSLSTGWR